MGTPEPSDAELLESDGSIDAFALFYRRNVDSVLRYFYRRTDCAQTAADLTAETFAQALASRRRFRDVGAPARAWLFTIARRQLANFVRKQRVSERARRRAGMQPLTLGHDDIERIESLVDFDATAEAVRSAVAELPAIQVEAIELRIADGLPYREIATRLGCSEGAARVRVSRGLNTLAGKLEDHR